MNIHQYVMPIIASNMYIAFENDCAIIIDPHENEDALQFVKESDFSCVDIILTHEHFDHISGVPYFEPFVQKIYASKKCAEIMAHPELRKENRFSELFFKAVGSEKIIRLQKEKPAIFATQTFEGELSFLWQGHSVKMTETPGHSPGSICVLFGEDKLFTGDSLIPKKLVITKFNGGSKEQYEKITRPYLESFSGEVLVYPGHGKIAPLKECWI